MEIHGIAIQIKKKIDIYNKKFAVHTTLSFSPSWSTA